MRSATRFMWLTGAVRDYAQVSDKSATVRVRSTSKTISVQGPRPVMSY